MNVTILGSRVFANKMRACWVKIGPKSHMTDVFLRRGRFGHIDIDLLGRRPCGDGSRD